MQAHRLLLPTLLLCLSSTFPAAAADQSGRFVIKGAGTATCKDYLEAYQDKPGGFLLYLGWIGGYVTAVNQYRSDTYDLTSWESMGLLAAVLQGYCREHQQTSFFNATQKLVEALNRDSLKTFHPGIDVYNRGVTLTLTQPLLSRVQHRLAELGHYQGDTDGEFGDAAKAAMSAYQKKHGLPPTGLPDQLTLFQMFHRQTPSAD